MSSGPLFELPNGTFSETAYLSTTRDTRFFKGTLPEDADFTNVSVSIRGASFTTDPDLIQVTETDFTIPNPIAYPDGLPLLTGENKVEVRASSYSGPTREAFMVASLVSETDLETMSEAPTNIRCQSHQGSVTITIDKVENSKVVGYHFYASSSPGGGSGYTRINAKMITTPEVIRSELSFGEMDVDIPKVVDEDGRSATEPQLLEVSVRQRDLVGNTLSTDAKEAIALPSNVTHLRAHTVLTSYTETETFSFEHDRQASTAFDTQSVFNSEFAALPNDRPLYYVATAVYYDDKTNSEVESPYSPEVAAHPGNLIADLKFLPQVTRQQLTQKTVESIYVTNPEIAVHPGSVIRDIFIDPFVEESMRLRTVIDFLHKATSFPTLLSIDDPLGVGESIDPTRSEYKKALAQALYLVRPGNVQVFINKAFDKLAANLGVTRLSGSYARGQVTFYTTTRPTTSVSIPIGTVVTGGGAAFRTTSNVYMDSSMLASYYNPTTKRYSVTVGIKANQFGSAGNLAAGQITTTNVGMSVFNEAPTFGGSDVETNIALAQRASNRIASVDTGTEQGYLYAAASLPGVSQVKVVSAGDPLMMRDYDQNLNKHVGGKVDIWIQGEQLTNSSDTFAFQFEYARDIQFELISNISETLEFRALDPNLTNASPMLAMLDYTVPKLGLQNASTGEYFDLTGVEITSHNTIKLNMDIDQPEVDYGDVVLGDYRYRTGSNFVLRDQPVREILSLTGSSSGSISSSAYTLVRPNSPLTTGRSTNAGAYLKVSIPLDPSGLAVPAGDLLEVEDESHLMTGDYIEYLGNLGVLPLTIKVTSEDGFTEYRGPYHPSGIYDYSIIDGDQTTPISIQRAFGGAIADGQTVLVSYKHDENFTVRYTSNLMATAAQEDVNALKHLTADVLVKETTEIKVNVGATIVVQSGFPASAVDSGVRLSLSTLFSNLPLGASVRQSDVIEAIDSSEGVSHLILPLVKMCLADGSQIIREIVEVGVYGDYVRIQEMSTPQNNVYFLQNELAHATSNGGGAEYGHYVGVFKDDFEMNNITTLPSLMGRTSYQTFIIGNAGMVIPGYSDDTTLRGQGYVTDAEISARRIELTRNRVLVSLPLGETPDECEWSVTYTTDGDTGYGDLEIGPSSYFRLGEAEFTFDSERESTRFRRTQGVGSSGRSSGASSGGSSGGGGRSSGGGY